MMTDLERAQRIEAALQLRIGRLEFQVAILEIELADARADRDAAIVAMHENRSNEDVVTP